MSSIALTPAAGRRAPSQEMGLRAWVEHALLNTELATLRPLCVLAAVLMGAALIVDGTTPLAAMRPVVLVHDVVSCVAAAAAALAHTWLQRRQRWIRPTVALVAAMLISNTVLTLALTRDMVVVAHAVIFFAGFARVTTSLRWLLAVLLPSGVACTAVAVSVATPAQVGNLTIAVLGSLGLAVVMAVTRRRAESRLATSTYRSDRRHARVVRALSQAETELARRHLAEAERESLRTDLLQAQKLQAIGTLAGGVAHDMNNILTAIQSSAQAMKGDLPADSALAEDIETVLLAVRRGADLTHNLLTFARKEKRQSTPLQLADVVADVRALLVRTLPKEVAITTRVEHRVTVIGDRNMLHHALLNLCLNAADAVTAAARPGSVEVVVGRRDLEAQDAVAMGLLPGGYATVTVKDTGVGMTEEVRARAFEPFFTTKPTGKGTGLGLAMVYGASQAHGGVATISSVAGAGTSVQLVLPETAAKPLAKASAPTVQATTVRGRRVLIVDDESLVRRSTRRVLERAGFQVEEAVGGAEALAAVDLGQTFDAVVLDMAMPNMTGAECFALLRARLPGLPVLIASGYSRTADVERLLSQGAVAMLDKPFDRGELLGALVRLCDLACQSALPAADEPEEMPSPGARRADA